MSENAATGLIIPMDRLSEDALRGLIEEFILREGTDYGINEVPLETKFQQVLRQLKAGHVSIVFDFAEETTSILRKENLPKNLENL
jgi:uncharacterized protein YheU (UPF0270 family)